MTPARAKNHPRPAKNSKPRKSPPILSMTGFGRHETEGERGLAAEIRSVNHRYLEAAIRLPQGLQALENRLRAHLQERVARGKLNLTVGWKGGEERVALHWNRDLARQYFEALQEMRQEFDLREPIALGHILSHPEILHQEAPEVDEDAGWKLLRAAVDPALDGLLSMREAEGEALRRDLLARLVTLRKALKTVEKRAPQRAVEVKEKLHARVADLLRGEADVDSDRILVEAAFQAERMDCTEECVRLASHFDQFESMLLEGGAVGRKLNFLLQEMNREANTIGSKANDVAVAREVIQIKEELEILREQVQNLE